MGRCDLHRPEKRRGEGRPSAPHERDIRKRLQGHCLAGIRARTARTYGSRSCFFVRSHSLDSRGACADIGNTLLPSRPRECSYHALHWPKYLAAALVVRMWVIQEVAVAKSLAVICNCYHFSWKRLLYTAQWISLFEMEFMNASAEEAKETPFFPNITFKSLYRWKLENGEPILILDLLENASSCLASNPRDMIFSVLGLASDIEALPTVNSEHKFVCYYERSVQEVYTDFAKVQIRTHNTLDVITFSRNYNGRIAAWPSWVPDWSALRKSSCFSLSKLPLRSAARLAISNSYAYRASGGRYPEFDFLQGDTLRVSGIRVDTLTQLGEPYFDQSPPRREIRPQN